MLNHSTPRKQHGSGPSVSVSDSFDAGDVNGHSNSAAAAAAMSSSTSELVTISMDGNSSAVSETGGEEREQRLLYLRQAFCRFFKAKAGVEMENLGRVICAILGLSESEQQVVMESISKMAPAVVVTSTFDSITSTFESLFL